MCNNLNVFDEIYDVCISCGLVKGLAGTWTEYLSSGRLPCALVVT